MGIACARKLNSAQLNYTVGEKELLEIIERFKAFEGMIRSQELTVHRSSQHTVPKRAVSTHGEVEANDQRVASNYQTCYRI